MNQQLNTITSPNYGFQMSFLQTQYELLLTHTNFKLSPIHKERLVRLYNILYVYIIT